MGFRTVCVVGLSLVSQNTGFYPGLQREERCLLSLKSKMPFPKLIGEGPETQVRIVLPVALSSGTGVSKRAIRAS